MNDTATSHPASFRDPAGQVIFADGRLLRLVKRSYQPDFDHFLSSGLYDALGDKALVVKFEEGSSPLLPASDDVYKVLAPEKIDLISYPYEWSFSQLRDAALLTLAIQKTALSHGMCLKDASAFNIQFQRAKPIHIDTLSFERYQDGAPWVAYRQFCQHFLAPLALMAYRDVSAGKLLCVFSDGIPLDVAARLLGSQWIRRPSLWMHIMLHGKLGSRPPRAKHKVHTLPKTSLIHLIGHLEKLISSLPVPTSRTHWSDYQGELPYTPQEQERKISLVREYCQAIKPRTVWDIGANDGKFSRIAAAMGAQVTAIENEHALVERMYGDSQEFPAIFPLWMNMLSPSPMNGWAHTERQSLAARGPADMLLCLAFTHHLAITGQIPFSKQAEFFSHIAGHVVVEFVSPNDPNAALMLEAQPALRATYSQAIFEDAFGVYFSLQDKQEVNRYRTLYHFKRL